jgi:hypothetical protein
MLTLSHLEITQPTPARTSTPRWFLSFSSPKLHERGEQFVRTHVQRRATCGGTHVSLSFRQHKIILEIYISSPL